MEGWEGVGGGDGRGFFQRLGGSGMVDRLAVRCPVRDCLVGVRTPWQQPVQRCCGGGVANQVRKGCQGQVDDLQVANLFPAIRRGPRRIEAKQNKGQRSGDLFCAMSSPMVARVRPGYIPHPSRRSLPRLLRLIRRELCRTGIAYRHATNLVRRFVLLSGACVEAPPTPSEAWIRTWFSRRHCHGGGRMWFWIKKTAIQQGGVYVGGIRKIRSNYFRLFTCQI